MKSNIIETVPLFYIFLMVTFMLITEKVLRLQQINNLRNTRTNRVRDKETLESENLNEVHEIPPTVAWNDFFI